MKKRVKFGRVINGKPSFAEMEIETITAGENIIEWDSRLKNYEHIYKKSVKDGVSMALNAHLSEANCSFRITDFIESPTDTNEVIVSCVATSAAWQALGNEASQVSFQYNEKEEYWYVIIES